MNKHLPLLAFLLLISLTSCNLPASVDSNHIPGQVQITSPQDGAALDAGTVEVKFTAAGGPFIEANLLVDQLTVSYAAQDATSPAVSGSLSWSQPTNGKHTLTISLLTMNKETVSASVQVLVGDVSGAGDVPSTGQTPVAQPAQSESLDSARQRIIQILHDEYGINMTNPPIGRKEREGVTSDPWTSAIYYKDTFISISIYPDGREDHHASPLNYSDPGAQTSLIKPGDKPIPMCRPSGTVKLLVVFVDYQNLGVTQQEAFDALSQTVSQINGKYFEASQAAGVQNPLLKLQATPAYISSPPATEYQTLTPDLTRALTGYDPAAYDILIQIDLDANDSSGKVAKAGSFGWATSGCGALPVDVNMWISISTQDQLSPNSSDARLSFTLGHEILHTMGYPIGLTGVHEWVCGDGTIPDPADQCDQNNLPTLMMGWTDTDGDGVVEILDSTPYGLQAP